MSHPSRGAWIEIPAGDLARLGFRRSHPSRGAWIEIFRGLHNNLDSIKSHPSRGAWIEMLPGAISALGIWVAPLTGCVD